MLVEKVARVIFHPMAGDGPLSDDDVARAAIEAVFDEMAEPGEEALRMAVALFHVMARTRIPNYELPADSRLEATARGIWTAMLAAKRKEALP